MNQTRKISSFDGRQLYFTVAVLDIPSLLLGSSKNVLLLL